MNTLQINLLVPWVHHEKKQPSLISKTKKFIIQDDAIALRPPPSRAKGSSTSGLTGRTVTSAAPAMAVTGCGELLNPMRRTEYLAVRYN